ncbi:MAG: hypothetical protein V9G19_22615 [Tetrasphaera sp.]
MTSTEELVRAALRETLDDLSVPPVPPGLVDGTGGRGNRAGIARRTLVGAATVGVAGVVGVVVVSRTREAREDPAITTSRPTPSGSAAIRPQIGSWQRLPDPPMAPRQLARAVTVDGRVVVLGGRAEARSCRYENNSEPPPPEPDGAILDLASRRWTRISVDPRDVVARACVAASGLVVAGGGDDRPWAGLDPVGGSWHRFSAAPLPWATPRAGDDRYAYFVRGTDEDLESEADAVNPTPARVAILDVRTGDWTLLPPDPLGPSFERSLAPTPAGLVVLSKQLTVTHDPVWPRFLRAAIYRHRQWETLPPLRCIGTGQWQWTGRRLVLAALSWGRADVPQDPRGDSPFHGWLDPVSGRSGPLRGVPQADGSPTSHDLAGAEKNLILASEWLYDDATETWTAVGSLPRPHTTGHATTLAGGRIVVVGGFLDSGGCDDPDGLTNASWISSG